MEVPAEKAKAASSTDGFIKIQLGKIGDVARVLVNGKQYGYAWTGSLRGVCSEARPEEWQQRNTDCCSQYLAQCAAGCWRGKGPFKGIWTNAKYRTKSKALLPAGLLSTINIVY